MRLLLLASKLGYQTRGFAEAAQRVGAEVIFATDRCHQLDDPWRDGAIAAHFEKPEQAAARILAELGRCRVDAVLALGDRATTAAAYLTRALSLPGNSPRAVAQCHSKLLQREALRDAGLRVPEFFALELNCDSVEQVARRAQYPCVLKPLALNASQGVIRANNADEFRAALRRISALLAQPELQVLREPALNRVLVESYIPGEEVAVECLLDRGRLRVLAIFDKPDPLEGPYFEETIYVTPSRQPPELQQRIIECAEQTGRALGLTHGPAHLEFRINQQGVWPLEAAPRPIGGLCSRALRFGPQAIFLEELLVRNALALDGGNLQREAKASGVMMIPVPASGVLERVRGMEQAQAVTGVDEVHITARLRDYIAAWPEGSSYLGFIFARAQEPATVEAALRAAHAKLQLEIRPRLPTAHPVTGELPVA
ncbi:MAG: ATP-grasp domain-containing protein [Candidatus Acidiferrales bacterium]